MEINQLFFNEMILLQMYLGSVIYVICSIASYFIMKHYFLQHIVLWLVAKLLLSVTVSLLIWCYWPFHFDIMVAQFINLPALFSESILVFLLVVLLKINNINQ